MNRPVVFFFAFANLARLDGFLVYAVVYAVYFFPWRLLKSRGDRGDRGRQGDRGAVLDLP